MEEFVWYDILHLRCIAIYQFKVLHELQRSSLSYGIDLIT